jgi:hypothetical protein
MVNTVMEILIDASGSMGYMKGQKESENKYLIEGQTRMSLMKKLLLTDIIPTVDYCSRIFIRTFRTEVEQQKDKLISRGNKIHLIYEDDFNFEKIKNVINLIENPLLGGTPITAAIDDAVANLAKYPNEDRKIILLTDGEENGGGDYLQSAKKVSELDRLPCKIFVVGIAQDKDAEAKARQIANGAYVNLKAANFSAAELTYALAQIKSGVIKDSITNIEQKEVGNIIDESKDRPQSIKDLKNKIEVVEHEKNEIASINSIEILENKIKNYFQFGEKIISELSLLKDSVRLSNLTDSGLDATTLSVDDDYKEEIRQKSEQFLYSLLCEKYGADKVKWLNQDGESFAHHDFEILNGIGGIVFLIDCKGTPKNKPTFYLTDKEWNSFLKNKEIYSIYRVFGVDSEMKAFCIENLLSSILSGQVVPYLLKPEVLKNGRVFLTLLE